MDEKSKSLIEEFKLKIAQFNGLLPEDPDELFKRDPIEYERKKQELIKSSRFYEGNKDEKGN